MTVPVFIDEDGEEPEKEMGDANAEDIVDEKQWDDQEDANSDDGGEDGRDQEQEKFEKNSRMQGEAIEGEMRTREEDEQEAGEDEVSWSEQIALVFGLDVWCGLRA